MNTTEQPVAIVTGASSGIGLGITQALLDRGWNVVGTSRTISKSKDLKPSPELVLVDGEASKKQTATEVADAAATHFGRIDPDNIRFNTVSPGAVNTPMHSNEDHSALARFHPLGRIAEISDIVDAVLYLQNATFVTGENIRVDGGFHAGR